MRNVRGRIDPSQSAADEHGLSLIELIVVVVVLGLILSGVAVMFANILTTEQNVTTQSDATVRGQSFASRIEKAMRDASAYSWSSGSLTVQMGSGGSATCEMFSAATANVRLKDDAVTFSSAGSRGIHYAFQAIGGAPQGTSPVGAAPVKFSGDAFMRNSTALVLTCP